jgi:hypothetical protein
MQVHLRARRATTCALAGVLALAGCSTGAPSAAPTAGAPATTTKPATQAPPSAAPPTESGPTILEDAGLETPLTPGTYTSRVFEPAVTLELGEGWFRRDDIRDRTFNLRRGSDGGEMLSFISGIDFIQCGKGDVIEPQDASTVVDEIVAMDKLHATQPAQIEVGDMLGTMIRLPGTGAPLPEDAFDHLLDFGCVISIGDVPFPGDSGWVTLTRDTVTQLVFVEVGNETVLIRTSPDDGTTDIDGLWDLMTDVINSTHLG